MKYSHIPYVYRKLMGDVLFSVIVLLSLYFANTGMNELKILLIALLSFIAVKHNINLYYETKNKPSV